MRIRVRPLARRVSRKQARPQQTTDGQVIPIELLDRWFTLEREVARLGALAERGFRVDAWLYRDAVEASRTVAASEERPGSTGSVGSRRTMATVRASSTM